MGCEAKLGSKRGTDATSTPTSRDKNGGQDGTACGLHGQIVQRPLRPVSLNPMGRYAENKQEKEIDKNKTC